MRVLLVSSRFPMDLRRYVSGVFQRMRMFVDAIKEIAELDVLFYTRPELDVSSSTISMLERSF